MSTELVIFNAVKQMTKNADSKKTSVGLYYDFSRAFDIVNHEKLLNKLEKYGIRGVGYELIRSYLANRSQVVNIMNAENHYISSRIMIRQGVPQGSILGPILFLLYVNDLPKALNLGNAYQFADDTSVIITGTNALELSTKASAMSNSIVKWSEANILKLNITKTGLVIFNKSINCEESLYVKLQNRSIPISDHTKFLGVTMDATLSWQTHINVLNNRLSSICGVIRYLRDQVSVCSLRTYYYAHMQSLISYGIIFWGSSVYSQKIFITQKRILRCILNLDQRSSCKEFFCKLDILPVSSLYFLGLVCFVKKYPYLFLRNSGQYSNNMHINTRQCNKLAIPSHKSTYYEKGAYYQAIKAYSSLPKELKNITVFKKFRSSVISYLRHKCYYSFNCWLI
ncbi:rho GDP-dissociation inhibitor isoform X1 [Leptinotarsa decemlineata]|uniref:rho GDP-dissociation inhibitor isoform X1 n=1 Tax=Leptinotarsa decemlineata TaxID=7539 RepID=UPI003D309E8B